jgi:hypothetical protein
VWLAGALDGPVASSSLQAPTKVPAAIRTATGTADRRLDLRIVLSSSVSQDGMDSPYSS